MRIRLHSSAINDLEDGFNFYENQDEHLGDYFLDSLSSDIDSLQIYAGVHQKYFGNYYRMVAKRFPFAIYYRIEDKTVVVYAVLDCRRRPAWVRRRLG